jgi:hypothetical protein
MKFIAFILSFPIFHNITKHACNNSENYCCYKVLLKLQNYEHSIINIKNRKQNGIVWRAVGTLETGLYDYMESIDEYSLIISSCHSQKLLI